MSLEIYTTLSQPYLSYLEYVGLRAAAAMLATYDDKDQITHSLSYNTGLFLNLRNNFLESTIYTESPNDKKPLLSEVTDHEIRHSLDMIEQRNYEMLYGSAIGRPTSKHNHTPRFIPNGFMHSETDQIVYVCGGRVDHFAIARIIKIGVTADGQYTKNSNLIHHYDYFKIENNVGSGCHQRNLIENTCSGTYITKIYPSIIQDDNITPCDIDPFRSPLEYQTRMTLTIERLLKTEYQIMLYRRVQTSPKQNNNLTYSPPESREAKEWQRLKTHITLLSGQPWPAPIQYNVPNPCKLRDNFNYSVANRREFMQTAGSCTALSVKSFLRSILGITLTTQHTNFLQKYNGDQQIQFLREQLALINSQIKLLEPLYIKVSNANVATWLNEFKRFTCLDDLPGVKVQAMSRDHSCICIDTQFLKQPALKFSFYFNNRSAAFLARNSQTTLFPSEKTQPAKTQPLITPTQLTYRVAK